MGIIEDVFQMEGKERKVQERLKMWKENPCQKEDAALAWDRQLCLGQWQWMKRGWRQPHEIPRERKESKRTSETPQSTWLGGAQWGSLWLCYAGPLAKKQKMRFQVSCIDRSRFPERRTVREVRRGGKRGRASDRAKKRVHRFRVWFRWKRRASRLPCLSLGLGDYWRGTSRSGDESLAIFITSVSGSESLASFTNCTFHLKRPPGLGERLMPPKRMEDLAAFSAREVKRAAAKEKERDENSSAKGQWESK